MPGVDKLKNDNQAKWQSFETRVTLTFLEMQWSWHTGGSRGRPSELRFSVPG